jgi:type IX secretion system PorP/SprF family membrane protein
MIRTALMTLSLLLCSAIYAQQEAQYSLFFMNDYAINPAVAGLRKQMELRSLNRYQWEGITDAPRTYTLSFTAPLSDGNMGAGVYLFTDIVGPTRRIGAQGSYAYRIPLSGSVTLGFGLSVGILQYSIDADKIKLAEDNDPALGTNLSSVNVIDAKMGAMVSGENFHVGFSIPQLSQANLNIYPGTSAASSSLVNHYLLNAGYKYELTSDFMIEPNVLLKMVTPAPLKIDATLRVLYKDIVWLGGGYRNSDAFTAMLGVKWNNKIHIAYAHDFTTTDVSKYSTGTHEIMLGIDLPDPRAAK